MIHVNLNVSLSRICIVRTLNLVYSIHGSYCFTIIVPTLIAYKLQISAMFLSDNKYIFLTIFVAQQYPINWIIETFFIQLT